MKTFKPKVLGTIFTLILDFAGLAIICILIPIIASYFIEGHDQILIIAIAIIAIISTYLLISSKFVKFEVSSDGQFCHYKKGRLIERITLEHFYLSYTLERSFLFVNSIDLTIYNDDTQRTIDCSALGENMFNEMLYEMQQHAMKKIQRIQ